MPGRAEFAAERSSVFEVGARDVVGEMERTDDQSEGSLAEEEGLSRGRCGEVMMFRPLLFLLPLLRRPEAAEDPFLSSCPETSAPATDRSLCLALLLPLPSWSRAPFLRLSPARTCAKCMELGEGTTSGSSTKQETWLANEGERSRAELAWASWARNRERLVCSAFG